MKWLGYSLSILFLILGIIMLALFQGSLIYYVSFYFGILIYWNFRPDWNQRMNSLKKTAVIASIIVVVLLIEAGILHYMIGRIQDANPGIISFFATPGIVYTLGVFISLIIGPLLLAYTEGLTIPDSEGYVRNPIFTLILILITIGLYEIYWLFLIKRALGEIDIQIPSLWWLLIPIFGLIYIYVKTSQGLEKKTNVPFIAWFLIFLFLNGVAVVINQAIINHKLRTPDVTVGENQ